LEQKSTHLEPFICPECNSFGYYRYKEGHDKLLICCKCGYKLAELNCKYCSCEWEISTGIQDRINSWKCPGCHSVNQINDGFYSNPERIRWEKKKVIKKESISKMLWDRKLYYLLGFLLVYMISFADPSMKGRLGFSISMSLTFGYLMHLFITDFQRVKREGQAITFSRESLIHMGLTFATMIIIGLLMKILG
jgi:hypothetical protein